TERAAKGRGYSANLFSNKVSPKGGQQLVEATLEELEKLYSKD
ncbi:MAG: Fur-regulated basic protein FbpA, partial [Clostridia bacterium]|nr:Fur-regulated basic protein FbpA [Clostridia bacterium]